MIMSLFDNEAKGSCELMLTGGRPASMVRSDNCDLERTRDGRSLLEDGVIIDGDCAIGSVIRGS